MSREVMVVLIIAIVFGYLAIKQYNLRNRSESKLKQRINSLESELLIIKQHASKEAMEKLEQRLQTLERIITDDSYQLKKDIQSL